jgi:hypothetical protein
VLWGHGPFIYRTAKLWVYFQRWNLLTLGLFSLLFQNFPVPLFVAHSLAQLLLR